MTQNTFFYTIMLSSNIVVFNAEYCKKDKLIKRLYFSTFCVELP